MTTHAENMAALISSRNTKPRRTLILTRIRMAQEGLDLEPVDSLYGCSMTITSETITTERQRSQWHRLWLSSMD